MQGDTMGDGKNRERQPRGTFVSGLCAGAMVGAGFALLFAPRSGSQLRERLADSAARAAAAVSSTVEALARRTESDANGKMLQSGQDMRRAADGKAHVGKGLATLGEMAALHGDDWREALGS